MKVLKNTQTSLFRFLFTCFRIYIKSMDSGGFIPGVWGRGSQIRGRQKVSLQQSLGITQKWLLFLGQENG